MDDRTSYPWSQWSDAVVNGSPAPRPDTQMLPKRTHCMTIGSWASASTGVRRRTNGLIDERGISFESVVSAIEQGGVVDVLEHPNQERYPGQLNYVVEVGQYIHLVPFVIGSDGTRFLKTINSQQESDQRLPEEAINMNDTLSAEERDILSRFERGELRSAPEADRGD